MTTYYVIVCLSDKEWNDQYHGELCADGDVLVFTDKKKAESEFEDWGPIPPWRYELWEFEV